MKILALIIISIVIAVTPISAFAAAPVITPQVFQITNDPSQQNGPLISGNLVAYTNWGGTQGIDIWGYDLKTKTNFPIVSRPDEQFLTGLHRNLVIYDDFNSADQTYDVRMLNRNTGQDINITPGPGTFDGGVTNGKYVAYLRGGACGTLLAYKIAGGATSQIATSACTPKISGNNLLWIGQGAAGPGIYGYNLASKTMFNVAVGTNLDTPNIFSNTVVWTVHNGAQNQIMSKDLASGRVTTLLNANYYVNYPAPSKRFVVWGNSHAPGTAGVEGIDLQTKQIFEVFPQGPHQNTNLAPAISGNTTVWQAWRTGNGDIYGAFMTR